MSLLSIGRLAQQRRGIVAGDGAAARGAAADSVKALEAAVPTEVVALYTAIIAGCQSVLAHQPHTTYIPFRLIVYLVALASTVYIAVRSVRPSVGGLRATAVTPEVLTATLAFAAWGLVLPGSFLFVWLSSPLLSVVIITITAGATFLLAVVLAPRLRSMEDAAPGGRGPALTTTPPVA